MKILIIDDDKKLIEYIKISLENSMPEVEIFSAYSAEEGLKQIENSNFELILIDYLLPKMNGIELIKILHEKNISSPIILLTGMGNIDIAVQALKSGASDYLNKDKIFSIDIANYISEWVSNKNSFNFFPDVNNSKIVVLYVEHGENDIILTKEYLLSKFNSFEILLASDIKETLKILNNDKVDIILSDLRLPNSSGFELIKILNEKKINIPIIIITGSGDEEAAVKALKLGAYDYIVKRKNYLLQLPHAIENAIYRFRLNQTNNANQLKINELYHKLEEKLKQSDADKTGVEIKLRFSQEQYTELFLYNPTPIIVFDEDTLKIEDVNLKAISHYGYSKEEFLSMSILDIRPEEEKEKAENAIRKSPVYDGIFQNYKHRKKSGEIIDVEVHAKSLPRLVDKKLTIAVVFDVTERNRNKELILEQLDELKRWQNVIIGREERNIELKQEVNDLLVKLGQNKKYFV